MLFECFDVSECINKKMFIFLFFIFASEGFTNCLRLLTIPNPYPPISQENYYATSLLGYRISYKYGIDCLQEVSLD